MPEEQPCLQADLDRGVLVLTVTRAQIEGEDVARQLREEMLAAVERTGASRIVIDLQHTRYVSSVAFWPLLALNRRLREQGGRLLVCGLTGAVHLVFTTTRMINSDGFSGAPFEVAEDRETALARLSGAQAEV